MASKRGKTRGEDGGARDGKQEVVVGTKETKGANTSVTKPNLKKERRVDVKNVKYESKEAETDMTHDNETYFPIQRWARGPRSHQRCLECGMQPDWWD